MAYIPNKSKKLIFFHVHSLQDFRQLALHSYERDKIDLEQTHERLRQKYPYQMIIEDAYPSKISAVDARKLYIKYLDMFETNMEIIKGRK